MSHKNISFSTFFLVTRWHWVHVTECRICSRLIQFLFRESWEAGTVPDVSPERSYSKRSSYASGKDGSISAEVEPKRKRAKIEMGRREASEAESAGLVEKFST